MRARPTIALNNWLLVVIIMCLCVAAALAQAGTGTRRAAVLSEQFDPRSIPGLKLWLKADSLALNDGDAVGTWSDLSGSGNDATQATASKKPTFRAGAFNNKPSVSFDGVDDIIFANSVAGLLSGNDVPFTIFIAESCANLGTGPALIYLARAATTNSLHGVDGGSGTGYRQLRRDDAGTLKQFTGGTADTAVHIVTERFSGTMGSLFFDGSQVGSDVDLDVGNVTLDRLTIGARQLGGTAADSFAQTNIAEVLIFDSALSQTDIIRVERYLGAKYGIVVR